MSGQSIQQHDPMLAARMRVDFTNYHPHAELYTLGVTGQSLTITTANTYYVLTGYEAVGDISGSPILTADESTGVITVGSKGAGLFMASCNLTMEADKVANIYLRMHINGTSTNKTLAGRESTTNREQIYGQGLLELSPGDTLDFRMTSSVNSTTIDVIYANIVIFWIAGI